MRSIYSEPVKPELIRERISQLRDAGVTAAGALSPQRTQDHWKTVVDAGVDLFFIRGTTVSAEHVSSDREPLNLKRFIYDLPGRRDVLGVPGAPGGDHRHIVEAVAAASGLIASDLDLTHHNGSVPSGRSRGRS